ncbi:hypothetical protein [Virgibacillus litoralis]|uniref:Uncharacterized protein n=1 Tax=Virgibacillus litoralis TaxID=578221 RepID=A0ABS4HEP6_9BACI|nr:hypothetical protein [Virgibacillus litoralis]MBP1949381.1 hypothetical protein [Virgibacillus litoralis]
MNYKKESTDYMSDYLNSKYEEYSNDILSEGLKKDATFGGDFLNINFTTLLDKIIFVLFYEFDKYDQVLKEIYSKIYKKLEMFEESEVDFLYAKCVEEIYNNNIDHWNVEGSYSNDKNPHIANEFVRKINQNIVDNISEYSGLELNPLLKEIQYDIENFSFNGPSESDDYNINNYWEEFCFQMQYGEGMLLDTILGDIESHLYSKLANAPIKDIILLYITTDEFNYENYHMENNIPLPPRDDMLDEVVCKLLDEIKDIAANTFIPDFSSGEDWEDE